VTGTAAVSSETAWAKSEPGSGTDLLRPTARIDQFMIMHSARLDNWREITGLAEKWQQRSAQT
jgi:hypothetical protein